MEKRKKYPPFLPLFYIMIDLEKQDTVLSKTKEKVDTILKQKGISTVVVMISFIALVLQGLTICLLFYILHSYQETAAKEWSDMKSDRDHVRNNCEDNAKTIDVFRIWSEQQGLKPPPNLLVSKQCNIIERKVENK